MTTKTFLEITDLPTDKYNILHKSALHLVDAYNNARTSADDLATLKATFKFLHSKTVEAEAVLKAKSTAVKATATQSVKPSVKASKTA